MHCDPAGIHGLHLQQIDDNKIIAANGTDASYYKSRMSLNEEIIALNKRNKILNDELTMVGKF